MNDSEAIATLADTATALGRALTTVAQTATGMENRLYCVELLLVGLLSHAAQPRLTPELVELLQLLLARAKPGASATMFAEALVPDWAPSQLH